jgi:hypothetical protein
MPNEECSSISDTSPRPLAAAVPLPPSAASFGVPKDEKRADKEDDSEAEESDDENARVMGRMTMKREANALCELMSGDNPGFVIEGEKVKPLEVGQFAFKPTSERPGFPSRG